MPAIEKPAPFTMDELATLKTGLDSIIRAEGQGLAQTGLTGISQGRGQLLSQRFSLALSALAKIEALALELAPPPGNEG